VRSVAFVGLLVLLGAVLGLVAPSRTNAGTLQADRGKARRLAAEVSGLDVRIDAAVERYVRATQTLRAVREQIDNNKHLQLLAKNQLGLARATLEVRAVALYKNDDVSALDAIFTAGDFGELVDQLAMLRSVARSDRDMVRVVVNTKQELADRAVSLIADRRTAERLVVARSAEVKGIRDQLAAREALLRGVRTQIRTRATKLAAATPSPGPSATPSDNTGGHGPWWTLIQQAAAANGIDPHGMYRLMMIESGGNASVVSPGGFCGLFQYAPSTWKGSWNPCRSSNITDGAAQIRATALALKLGYGHAWWDPSYSLAFGGG
jgi:hypothetical protein